MSTRFHCIDLQDFSLLLQRFPFTRKINSIHMHHTWRPNHSQFKGHETIMSMWRFHTEKQGWSDIAQHITIDPEGKIWLGRNWNQPPASAKGHNGNKAAGPFMFEMIGDFDTGHDRFEGEQKRTALKVIALVQKHFKLGPETLRFHSQMSSKTCPGAAIDYDRIVAEVRDLHASAEGIAGTGTREASAGPFGDEALEINEWFERFVREAPIREDSADAEPFDEEMRESELFEFYGPWASRVASARGEREVREAPELHPEMLSGLRPHVINLTQGRFSSDGLFTTTGGDIHTIFGKHLERELEKVKNGDPLRIVFYAHGGLVSESNALRMAHKHVSWWMKNGVYPIYFVWETGLFETIGQLLARSSQHVQRAGRRDLWDYTTDPAIETMARVLYGPGIWSGMKRSAERASAEGGGARYVAERLKEFCDKHPGRIELHAIGHSAGSIFHAHFIPAALDAQVPSFRSVHFLAPAIRADEFHARLAGRLGAGIDKLSIFTMSKDFEEADHCAHIYRKSLLYLIYHALEAERKTPVLGLDICLRNDRKLQELFGLARHEPAVGEVIWSVSHADKGLNASTSRTHGGFDDDAATMNNVLRRILGMKENQNLALSSEFPSEPGGRRGQSLWSNQFDLPEGMAGPALNVDSSCSPPFHHMKPLTAPQPPRPVSSILLQSPATDVGRRRALCVGINRYPSAPLSGCVADARSWVETLVSLGFEQPEMLIDEQATRSAVLDSLSHLVASSAPGDVVVFQFAGHGTQLPDISGDELGPKNDRQDEALCPYDFHTGAFILDDDVAEIFAGIPDGVNVTCFIDCCHSGTITRFAVGTPMPAGTKDPGLHARFMQATPEMQKANLEFRQKQGGRRRALGSRGPESMREILFSACNAREVAWESAGQGEFTVRATKILRSGANGMTNKGFQDQVTAEFGLSPRQHPELDCAQASCGLGLLQPFSSAQASLGDRGIGASAAPGQKASLAQLFRTIASVMES